MLEIKELVIKATVVQPLQNNAGTGKLSGMELKRIKKEIIEECMEKLHRELDKKR